MQKPFVSSNIAKNRGEKLKKDKENSEYHANQSIFQNILSIFNKIIVVILLLGIWQALSYFEIVPRFFLPAPTDIFRAFVKDFPLIMHHLKYTIMEMILGTAIAISLAFVLSIILDWSQIFYEVFYTPIIISQTIPSIAIAPLLIIWFGYDLSPKVILVVITVFFPILIGLLDGYRSVDKDSLKLLKTMGASKWQMYTHVKLPASVGYFFAGLRVSVSYALISAVVAEWLGGYNGLGVYMMRVRKAFAMDKMFAIIFFISALSLLLMALVDVLQKKIVKY